MTQELASQPSRRRLLRLCAGAGLAPFAAFARDETETLAAQLREGRPVRLPPGVTAIRSLQLPAGASLIGARGGSTLRLIGSGPLLYASGASNITLEAIFCDGAGAPLEQKRGLLDFVDVAGLAIRGCAIKNASAHGVNFERCGGVFAQNTIERAQAAGLFSLDGLGLDIDGNTVRDCGDNGVMVWTSALGRYDASRIRNNAISDIHNVSGGDGPYGNGVSIFRAGAVRVENNKILRCAYTAVRNNAGYDVYVAGNDCKSFGEKAMYAEFGAKRAIFRDNKIVDAGGGIAVVNGDYGTDGGAVTGNTVVNLFETHPDAEFGPDMFWLTGIMGERNCEIAGNTVVGPAWIGVALGGFRENLRVVDNTIKGADYGIGFATGAGLGDALIARNRITASRKAAIAAMEGSSFLPGDLLAPSGAGGKYPRVALQDNVAG